jgi:hypothetical protein
MPKHGACWIFTNAKTGATQYASVEGSTATHWLLILARTDDLHKITRLSRAHWQPTWHVRWTCFCRNTTAYYDAVALGDLARAEKIDRAMRDKTQMPKPLPADAVIPDLVELAEAERW